MLTLKLRRVPLLEPDVDGPQRVGWTWGMDLLNDAGDVLAKAEDGMTGPKAAIEEIIETCQAQLDAGVRIDLAIIELHAAAAAEAEPAEEPLERGPA